MLLAKPGNSIAFRAFTIQPIVSTHSVTGESFQAIPRAIHLPMSARSYGEGGTLCFLVGVRQRSILFIDSANFVESALSGVHPDVAVVAVALREKVTDYSCRLMVSLGFPPLVIANHFDEHWEPIAATNDPVSAEQRADLLRFADEVRACSPTSKVLVPRIFRPIEL